MSDKFLYEDPQAFVADDGVVVGRKYNADAIVLDYVWHDDDHINMLMVEEEEDHPDKPFVAIRVHIDALDVREELWREETIRYALIEWENM